MTRAAILRADDLRLLPEVPLDAPLVLDFGASPFQPAVLQRCTRARYKVAQLLLSASALAETGFEAFLGKGVPVLLRLEKRPTIAEVLAHAGRLARPELQLQLPLETDEDLDLLKILGSLGVCLRLPVQALRTQPELVGELMADALARPGPRAPLSPFAELERGFFDEQFELARLDLVSNDHHVDLRGAEAVPAGTVWQSADVFAKRTSFLRQRSPCAFCEGLCYCHGYLFSEETFDTCRGQFAEFMQLFDRRHASTQAGDGPPAKGPNGRGKGSRPAKPSRNGGGRAC